MFDILVWTVGYRVEIWGKEKERIEKNTEKILKMGAWSRGKNTGVFNKGRNAEGNDEKQNGEEGSFEERLDMGKGSELAQACRKEIRERALGGKDVSKWEKERGQFFKNRELEIQERQGMEGDRKYEELEEREKVR